VKGEHSEENDAAGKCKASGGKGKWWGCFSVGRRSWVRRGETGGEKGLRRGEVGLGGRSPRGDPGALLLLLLLAASPTTVVMVLVGTAVALVGAEAVVSTRGGEERRGCGGLLLLSPLFLGAVLSPIKPKERSRAAISCFCWRSWTAFGEVEVAPLGRRPLRMPLHLPLCLCEEVRSGGGGGGGGGREGR